MKILCSWGYVKKWKPFLEREIKECINAGYEITLINHREELGGDKVYAPGELYKLYQKRNPRLMHLYEKITSLARTHDVFIVRADNVYIPEFLESLTDIYKVYLYSDDPEGSFRSKPYVHAFDHCFAGSVNFDKITRTWQKYLEWGAKRADWWPYGIGPGKYDPSLTVEGVYSWDRDVDLVYVGSPWLRLERLVQIKRAFPQMKIYGHGWNWQVLLADPFSHRRTYGSWNRKAFAGVIEAPFVGLWKVKELPMDELVPLYQRCKIGINMHLSHGPTNLRLYQLPANGVMQICDCPEGLDQVFEVGKEVVAYQSIEEAIELIRYYLEHNDERNRIAAVGFKRAMKDYKTVTIFTQAIEKIKKGMTEDGITHFKNGTRVELGKNPL